MSENLIGATTAVFPIRLSVAVASPVDVEWATRDGSAVAGSDYKATAGTVTFLPGETEKQIEVQVYGQAITPSDDKVFFIRLNPPSNAVLVDAILTCTINIIDDQGIPSVAVVVAEGRRGPKGNPGLSAYEQAVLMGYTGTVEQWMDEIGDASQAAERAESFASQAAESAVIAGQKADEAAEAVISTKQYVDSALASQSAYLDSELANQTQTVNGALASQSAYLDSELANQTQTVNGALSDLSTAANKFYPTLAAANANIANIQVDQPITIGESANGGLWYKATSGATTLTKSAYDPLTQAKGYADANKAFNPQPLVNTIDLNTVTTLGFYLCYATPSNYIAQNYPSNTLGFLRVYHSVASGSSQLSQSFTNVNGKTYTRYKTGSTFTNWYNDYDSSVAYTQAMTQIVNTINLVTGTDLNIITTSGYYLQNVSADATLALNFPVGTGGAGFLEVVKFNSSLVYQTYQVRDTSKVYKRRYTGTWSSWAEAGLDDNSITKAKLATSLKDQMKKRLEFFPVGSAANVAYNKTTKTLSWSHMILAASAEYASTLRLRIPAGSVTFSGTGYEVAYIDLTLVDSSKGNADISAIKVATYSGSGFLDKFDQVPIAKLDFAGNIHSCAGFLPITTTGVPVASTAKDTFRFVKQANQSYIYHPATNGNLIRYNFYRQIKAFDGTSPNSQSDMWRLADVYEANPDTLAAGRYIVVDGEWDCALRVMGAADHSGGVHGDEVQDLTKFAPYFLIDGCRVAQDAIFDGQVKELKFVQESLIFIENTSNMMCIRQKIMTVTKNGFKNRQNLVWKKVINLFTGWFGLMIPIKRTVNDDGTGGQITDTAIRFPSYIPEDVSVAGFPQVYTDTADGDEFIISGSTSGISIKAKMSGFKGLPKPTTHISSAQFYNKLYFSAIDSRVANYTTSVDEVWEVTSEFAIDIK